MASIVTAKELGQYLKLSESTIYKLASDGNLPGFKIGDSWRFDMEEVIKVIKKAKQVKTIAKNIGQRVKGKKQEV